MVYLDGKFVGRRYDVDRKLIEIMVIMNNLTGVWNMKITKIAISLVFLSSPSCGPTQRINGTQILNAPFTVKLFKLKGVPWMENIAWIQAKHAADNINNNGESKESWKGTFFSVNKKKKNTWRENKWYWAEEPTKKKKRKKINQYRCVRIKVQFCGFRYLLFCTLWFPFSQLIYSLVSFSRWLGLFEKWPFSLCLSLL